jgi:hypothetical protein
MAYVIPTPAMVKVRFPRFEGVADGTIQYALDRAAREVDETWTEGDFTEARMLYAAHQLTIDGLGTGTEAQLLAEGVGDFQKIELGSLKLTRFDKSSSSNSDVPADLARTTFGASFYSLALRNVGAGPMVLGASPGGQNALGRDYPDGAPFFPFRGW